MSDDPRAAQHEEAKEIIAGTSAEHEADEDMIVSRITSALRSRDEQIADLSAKLAQTNARAEKAEAKCTECCLSKASISAAIDYILGNMDELARQHDAKVREPLEKALEYAGEAFQGFGDLSEQKFEWRGAEYFHHWLDETLATARSGK